MIQKSKFWLLPLDLFILPYRVTIISWFLIHKFVFSANINSLKSWTICYSHFLPMLSYHLSRHLMIAEKKMKGITKVLQDKSLKTILKAFERIKKLPLECAIHIKAIVEITWYVKYDITYFIIVSSYFYTT